MDELIPPDTSSTAPVPGPAPRRGGLRLRGATAITAAGLLGGSLVGGFMVANAATTGSTSTASPTGSATGTQAPGQPPPGGSFDPTKGGHVGANGVVEKLLTGDTADKVRAAAQAAVSGATVERVETDAEGSPYEAHMVKSDGTHVTVKVDTSFKVTSVETDAMGH
jgi:hypothetical protein